MFKYREEALEKLYTFLTEFFWGRRYQNVKSKVKRMHELPIYPFKADQENYRCISLLNLIAKLFVKIISEEVAIINIREDQQRFHRNRSTTNAIFMLGQIAGKSFI